MLFRFRVCSDPHYPDQTQGWVAAASELCAREIIGCEAQLLAQPKNMCADAPDGTILVTSGALPEQVLREDCFPVIY
jgi:hypothetical protein